MRTLVNRVSFAARRGVCGTAALVTALLLPHAAAAQGDIVLQAASARTRAGQWTSAKDAGAIGGSVMRQADRGGKKVLRAVANPKDYFELTFQAEANRAYRLWLRGRAQRDFWGNDSVFIQFDRSITAAGAATFRIGTTSAAEVNLESCSGCRTKGWVWQDNGYGRNTLGPTIRFAKGGTQRLRVQTREDGLSIDQIVLSPSRYMTSAPTTSVGAPAVKAAGNGNSNNGSGSGSAGGGSQPGGNRGDDDDGSSAPKGGKSGVLKVLDWNIHHGVGTDGRYDINRLASTIAGTGANVVSLNEVERFTHWGNEDQPARFAALLRAKTGKRWNYNFAQTQGNAKGQGNLLLTTFDIEDEQDGELSHSRGVAHIAILVRGVRINIFSTHLDAESSGRRSQQIRELKAWAGRLPQQRILVGDFNAWPGAGEIRGMTAEHVDAWDSARKNGKAVAFKGNAAGNTRRSRIDYIFYSKSASRLKLTQARVFDARNSRGVMPSDHRPLMATFEVR